MMWLNPKCYAITVSAAFLLTLQAFLSIQQQHNAVHNRPATAKDCQVENDHPVHWNVENLSASELFKYFEWANSSSCVLVNFFGGFMSGGGTEVGLDGQKAVCLDKKMKPNPRKCLVYSFGINDDWSFDEAVGLFGCQVFAFDPTTNMTNHTRRRFSGVDEEYTHYNYSIEFTEMGIDDRNYEGFLKKANVPMRTLKTIYDSLKTRHGDDAIIDYLKIDIDYVEWRVLPEIIASGMMDRVRQLGIEIHLETTDTLKDLRWRASILRSLEDYGMIRFSSLYNEFSQFIFTQLGAPFRGPTGYEIAYYNSKLIREKDLF